MRRIVTALLASLLALLPVAAEAQEQAPAAAVEPEAKAKAVKRSDLKASLARPGVSGRLYEMPIAEVVGPFEMSVSYDGSLLKDPSALSSAGVFALGIGDLAQVEYRHTSAIGVNGQSVPLPAVGVQVKLPIPQAPHLPDLAVAFRKGVSNEEQTRGFEVTEEVTDFYGVARARLPRGIAIHLGLRYSQAKIESGSDVAEKSLWLPAIGIGMSVGRTSEAVAELGLAPQFALDADGLPSVATGAAGRLGLRWRIHPRFSLDASFGYLNSSTNTSGELLDWDIRLGGEVFVPWGALVCSTSGIFCE